MKQTLCAQYREEGREKGTGLRDGSIKDERRRDSDEYIFITRGGKWVSSVFLPSDVGDSVDLRSTIHTH
jgi:hypothetical protein